MKRCCTCHRMLPLRDFSRRAAAQDGRQNRCKGCYAEQYAEHREVMRAAILARHHRLRELKEVRLAEYLLEHPCVDCGAADLRVLDFDHRERAVKRVGIGVMLSGGWSWQAMLAEIAKCDVRCANCHRIRTSGQQGWWKQKLAVEAPQVGSALRLQALFPCA
jgi:hypothetical protein